ncbi:MAG: cache domain-containing protein, partial [Campylobacterota bacterium]
MSKLKQLQFQKRVGWLFGVLVLLLLMITYNGWSDYKKTQNLAQTQTQNLALLLQQKIQSDFERIDEVLAVAQSYVQESSSKCDITQKLQTLVQQLDGVEVLNYFDAQGALQCSSLESVEGVKIADRPHFLVLKNNPDIHKSFSNVITARTSGEKSIAQLRAVYSDRGEFMGIISALVTLHRFEDAIASIDVGQAGVTLLRKSDNSHLIARAPVYAKDDFNHPLPVDNPIVQRIEAGVSNATLSYTATTDGVQRLGSFKVLDGYPFYVQVAFAHDEYLAPWKVHMAILTAIVLVLSAFFVVIVRKLAYGYNIEMQTAQK